VTVMTKALKIWILRSCFSKCSQRRFISEVLHNTVGWKSKQIKSTCEWVSLYLEEGRFWPEISEHVSCNRDTYE